MLAYEGLNARLIEVPVPITLIGSSLVRVLNGERKPALVTPPCWLRNDYIGLGLCCDSYDITTFCVCKQSLFDDKEGSWYEGNFPICQDHLRMIGKIWG